MHTQRRARLQQRGQLEALILADQVGHGIGTHQNFGGGAASLPACQRQQLLGHNTPQNRCQLPTDLVLRTGGADVDNAVDGLRGADGVQRAEHQMPGFGGGHGGGDRFKIAHLTDQNHIRILAQGAAQRTRKAGYIHAHLALVDQRFFALIDVLDGVLDGQDMLGAALVDMLDHRRQRRGFAAAGGTGDQDQTARLVRHLLQHGGQPQLRQRGDMVVEQAQGGSQLILLHKHVGAAAGAVRRGNGKIGVQTFFQQGLTVAFVHHAQNQRAGVLVTELDGGVLQNAVDAELQRQPLRDVNIAGVQLTCQRRQFKNLHRRQSS